MMTKQLILIDFLLSTLHDVAVCLVIKSYELLVIKLIS